jgi:hypothetical protein
MASDRYVIFIYSKKIATDKSKIYRTIYDMEKDQEILSYHGLINDIDGFRNLDSPIFFNDSLWISYLPKYRFDEPSMEAIEKMYDVDFSKSINPVLVISKPW